jgi:cytoskeletal protein RodZ
MATVHFVNAPDGWVRRADQQESGSAGFGEWLRRAREARGLTLDDLTRETKIPLRNLEALEHGNLGVMPTFYQRAEVRAIAKVVGVDEGLAVDRLDSAIAPVVTHEAEVARPPLKLSLPAVSVALLLGVVALTAAKTGPAVLGWMAAPKGNQANPSPGTVGRLEPVALPSQPSSVEVAPAVAAAEATPDVKPPAGSVTELVVTTEPSGAHVTVNGIGWGVSPVTIRHLAPGDKHIRVTKEGFAATEGVLALDQGQRQALALRLATAP